MRGFLIGCRGGNRRFGGRGEPIHGHDEHVDRVVSTKVGELECVPWCYNLEKGGCQIRKREKERGLPIKSLGLRSVFEEK